MAWVTRTNLKGPTGTIDDATATLLPAGSAPTVELSGNPAHRAFHFGIPKGDRGAQGLPGFEAVPTDEGVAALISTDGESATKSALSATIGDRISLESSTGSIVPARKRKFGGTVPEPLRVPTLTTLDSWPNDRSGGISNILWQENGGKTLYGIGQDASFYKSIDGGQTWKHKAYLNWAPFWFDIFLKTAAGTLLTINQAHAVYRSTDDGVTWVNVGTLQAGQMPLGPQSWCIDKVTGDIYYGVYGGGGQTAMNLYRSTDDGLTWPVFHAFPGIASSDPNKITHIHAVQWDHVSERVWICAGDSNAGTGLYRVNNARDGVTPMITNAMVPDGSWPNGFFDAPRAIGIMPFPDYIAWASDSTNNPGLFRVARTELGKPNPTIERIYRTNSTNWWTAKASADGSRWVFSSSQEARDTHAIDKQVHLYAVEDQGSTVYEIAALAQRGDTLPAGSLQPIGLPEDQGDIFFLAGRTTGQAEAWSLRLADSASARLDHPPASAPLVGAWRTVNSGPVDLPVGESHIFHVDIAAAFARTLRVFDANVRSTDGSTGRIVVQVINKTDDSVIYQFAAPGARQGGRQEWSPCVFETQLPASTVIEVQAKNVHAGSSVKGLVSLTYGWGR